MKKLMFIISAIIAVGMVQAATVDWSYTVTGASANDAYSSGYTAYLFDAATWEGFNGTVTADNLGSALDSSAMAYKGSVGRGASTTYQFATKNSANTVGGLRDVSDDSWGASEDFYIVLVNNNEDPAQFVATAVTLTTHGAADSANQSGVASTTQAALNSATWSAIGGGSTPSGDVPEPTSGLLLAIGGAMLALRRRRA